MAIIEIFQNGKPVDSIPLLVGNNYIVGRDAACDIVLAEAVVSFHHARIESDGRGYLLVDLDSRNGTFVNGKKILSIWINNGDVISVGNFTLRFTSSERVNVSYREKMPGINETIPIQKDHSYLIPGNQSTAVKKLTNEFSTHLSLISLHDGRKLHSLGDQPILMGKGKKADIKLKGFGVGAKAAIIEKNSNGWDIRFIGGFLKPKVNNVVVNSIAKIRKNDIINFGKMRIQVVEDIK